MYSLTRALSEAYLVGPSGQKLDCSRILGASSRVTMDCDMSSNFVRGQKHTEPQCQDLGSPLAPAHIRRHNSLHK